MGHLTLDTYDHISFSPKKTMTCMQVFSWVQSGRVTSSRSRRKFTEEIKTQLEVLSPKATCPSYFLPRAQRKSSGLGHHCPEFLFFPSIDQRRSSPSHSASKAPQPAPPSFLAALGPSLLSRLGYGLCLRRDLQRESLPPLSFHLALRLGSTNLSRPRPLLPNPLRLLVVLMSCIVVCLQQVTSFFIPIPTDPVTRL